MFIVGYAGALGIANALDTLLEATNYLKERKIAIVLVGSGAEQETLRARATKLNAVYFLPPVPKKCVPELLEKMDILYIGLKKQPLFRFGISPNKLMDYMMAAKPVIQAIEAGNDPVREANCGASIPAEDPQAVAEAIITFAGMPPEELQKIGEQGRKYVLEHHDYRVLARHFLDVITTTDETRN
jgi:glycosyltransferase involved in cell wall biosynthesis